MINQETPYIIEIDNSFLTVMFFRHKNEDILEMLLNTSLFEKNVLIYSKFLVSKKDLNAPLLELFSVSRHNFDMNDIGQSYIDLNDFFVVDCVDNVYAETVRNVLKSPLLQVGYNFFEIAFTKAVFPKEERIDEIYEELFAKYMDAFIEVNITNLEDKKDLLSLKKEVICKSRHIIESNFAIYDNFNRRNGKLFKKGKTQAILKELSNNVIEKSTHLINEHFENL